MDAIMVLGATGLLGSSLVPYLQKSGYKVSTHSKNTGGTTAEFDLLDLNSTSKLIAQINPDAIVNLVGMTDVDRCELEPGLAYSTNVEIVKNIAHTIASLDKTCHLIHVSTDHLYDGIGPHSESEVNPKNVYAISKRVGEIEAMKVGASILRTNFLGASRTLNRASFTDWVINSLSVGRGIKVFNDVYFSPLSITTLVEMINLVIQFRPAGIFNLGSRNGMSKSDFCFKFATHMGLPLDLMESVSSESVDYFRAYRPKDMRLDSSKFEDFFKINLPKLDDELASIAKEYDEKI